MKRARPPIKAGQASQTDRSLQVYAILAAISEATPSALVYVDLDT